MLESKTWPIPDGISLQPRGQMFQGCGNGSLFFSGTSRVPKVFAIENQGS